MRQLHRHLALGLTTASLACVATACSASGGNAPAAPSSVQAAPPSGLRLGPSVLQLLAADRVSEGAGPIRVTCGPPSHTFVDKLHWNYGEVRSDGDAWIFEGGNPPAALRLRFKVTSGSPAVVSGVLWGDSLDSGLDGVLPPTGVRVRLDQGTVSGQLQTGPGLTGTVTGTITFTGADGSRVTCSEMRLQMQPFIRAGA